MVVQQPDSVFKILRSWLSSGWQRLLSILKSVWSGMKLAWSGLKRLWKEWKIELFFWCFATVSVWAILIILLTSRGKPIQSFNSRLQISTVISILSMAATNGLGFSIAASLGQSKWAFIKSTQGMIEMEKLDDASRGIYGSVKLFVRSVLNPTRICHLSTLATMTTLLMVAFGPFAQEAVKISLREVPDYTNNATINRSLSYPRVKRFSQTPDYVQGYVFIADPYLAGAIIAGIASDANLSAVTGHCPSGNCTWAYTTFAVCASTEDVTSSIVASPVPRSSATDRQEYRFSLPVPGLFSDVNRNISLPQPGSGTVGQATFWMGGLSRDNAALDYYVKDNSTIRTWDNLAEVFILYLPTDPVCANKSNDNFNEEWAEAGRNPKNWRAFKATFSLCLQDLNTTVANGVTNTVSAGPKPGLKWQNQPDDSLSFITKLSDGNETYGIEAETAGYLGERIRRAFTGNASFSPAGDNYYYSEWTLSMVTQLYGNDPFACSKGPDTGYDGFKKRMSSVANSTTNAFRSNPVGVVSVEGTTTVVEQFFKVTICWLIMPLAIWLFTTLLLIAAIQKAWVREVPLWKTSTLPTLLGVGDAGDKPGSGIDLAEQAKTKDVELRKVGENSWHLDITP